MDLEEQIVRKVYSKCFTENGNKCIAQGANCSVGYAKSKREIDEESKLLLKQKREGSLIEGQ